MCAMTSGRESSVSKKVLPVNIADNFTASPARLSPWARSKERLYIDMNGSWYFVIDQKDVGIKEEWFKGSPAFKEKLTVPGNWHSQGIGGKGLSNWVSWKEAFGWGDTRYEQLKVEGKYYGPAWYRRTIELPESWSQKIAYLKFGGAMPSLTVWVNEELIGSRYTDGTSFQFEVTGALHPGKNSVTVRIDNRIEATATAQHLNCFLLWGGLFDSVELEGAERVHISQVMISPNINEKQAELTISVTNSGKEKTVVEVAALVASENEEFRQESETITLFPGQSKDMSISVKINPLRLWSPEEPYLYRAIVNLEREGKVVDQWTDRFGMRTIYSEGGRLFLNEEPLIIRGCAFDGYFVNSISPWVKVEDYIWRLKKLKALGFTYHRLPWIPPRACFDAADEVGAMLEIEIPYVVRRLRPWRSKIKKRLLEELAIERNNHPALVTFSMENEIFKGDETLSEMYHLAKKIDPTRLAVDSEGAYKPRDTADFWLPMITHTPPARLPIASDYSKKPVIEHEYMNIPTLPDLDAINYYAKGMLTLDNLYSFRDWLIKQGLLERYENYLRSSYRLQGISLKRGIEFIRSHRQRDGYIVFEGSDVDSVHVWSGLLGTMYKEKGIKIKESLMYNSKSVLLVDTPPTIDPHTNRIEPIRLYNEEVNVPLLCSYYGREPITKGEVSWHLEYQGKILAQGKIEEVKAKSYEVSEIGEISLRVKERSFPIQSKLCLSLEEKDILLSNEYDLWFFPKTKPSERISRSKVWLDLTKDKEDKELALLKQNKSIATEKAKGKIDLIITDRLTPHGQYLEEGGRVILLSVDEFNHLEPGFIPGWWKMQDKSGGMVITEHPLLGEFPHEDVADLQFSAIADKAVIFNSHFDMIEPVISGITYKDYPDTDTKILAHLFQVNVGKGKLIVSGLDLTNRRVEAEYLLQELVEYALGDAFIPTRTVDSLAAFSPLGFNKKSLK